MSNDGDKGKTSDAIIEQRSVDDLLTELERVGIQTTG